MAGAFLIDGLDLDQVRAKFREAPSVFFKSYQPGMTESGTDENYLQSFRDTAAESAGSAIPLDFYVYQDAKLRGFEGFGNFSGVWAFRQRVVRAYWDQPAFGGKYAGRATGLETTVANESAGLADYAEQQTHGSDWVSDLAKIATVAGVVTGGLGLLGAFGGSSAGAAAGWVSAEAGAGYAAGLAADSVGLSLGSAAGIAKDGYSVLNGIGKLTASPAGLPATAAPRFNFQTSPSAPTNQATDMASPLDMFYASGAGNEPQNQQGAAVASPGGSNGAPPAAGAGTGSSLMLLALVAAVAWAFMEGDK